MIDRSEKILEKLKNNQIKAAGTIDRDVAVRAGAGSGKTTTLVAHYLYLLANGYEPENIAAITFTDKAAREMKSRVRSGLVEIANRAPEPGESPEETAETRRFWLGMLNKMDSARISTIHGFCSEILKTHPAEAGVDPRFAVLDEGESGMLRSDCIDRAIATVADAEEFADLFRCFREKTIRESLEILLEKRTLMQNLPAEPADPVKELLPKLRAILNRPDVMDLFDRCINATDDDLAGEVAKFVEAFPKIRKNMMTVREKLAKGGNFYELYIPLCEAFNGSGLVRKQNSLKGGCHSLWKELQELTAGIFSKGVCPCTARQAADYEKALPLLLKLYERTLADYRNILDSTDTMDFDALEEKAVEVLKQPSAADHWHRLIRAVLVDEFQDTNESQVNLIRLLQSADCHLYVVGDPQQSIYRFRRADVRVFNRKVDAIEAGGGANISLTENYRAHRPLIKVMNSLLQELVGNVTVADPAYYVEYSQLESTSDAPDRDPGPYIDILLGVGSREIAAQQLADRLVTLREQNVIEKWADVAILFRSASNFGIYEAALEAANIPYVTVAGRGFYDRPEIRDVLTMLRMAANPFDDNMLCGALLSPVIGFSADMLYRMRLFGKENHPDEPLWNVFTDEEFKFAEEEKQNTLIRARDIFMKLHEQAGRIRVDQLLDLLYRETDYRTTLALSSGERLWRNLDKLLLDARKSDKVVVSEFLNYIDEINQAGFREGEAPSDNDGAVQLMTIHKSKGLGFPVVVMAELGASDNHQSAEVVISEKYGVCVKGEARIPVYLAAETDEKNADEAEKLRVMYVAATRARQHLILSGHVGFRNDKPSLSGWVKTLCEKFNLAEKLGSDGACTISIPEPVSLDARSELLPADRIRKAGSSADKTAIPNDPKWLYDPIGEQKEENDFLDKKRMESLAVGTLVHKAIELSVFPGDPGFEDLLAREALGINRLDTQLMTSVKNRARELLSRFTGLATYREIKAADKVFHEVPFTNMSRGKTHNGYIDLLICIGGRWKVVDFKTDSLNSSAELDAAVAEHRNQLERYRRSVDHLLEVSSSAEICFLDYHGKVEIVPL